MLDCRVCDAGLCWWEVVASSAACRAFIDKRMADAQAAAAVYVELCVSPFEIVPKNALVMLDEKAFLEHVMPKLSKSARLRSFMRQ